MNTLECIKYKRAIRHFSEQPLPEDTILTILNAGRRAQSSKNSQPWNFVAITDRAVLQALSECGMNASHLAGATLGVAIVHEPPGEKFQLLFDIGQSAAYMQLAAWDLGIGSCLASIYEPEKAGLVLALPDGLTLRFAISFGFPQEPAFLTQIPKKGGRRSLDELIHWNKW